MYFVNDFIRIKNIFHCHVCYNNGLHYPIRPIIFKIFKDLNYSPNNKSVLLYFNLKNKNSFEMYFNLDFYKNIFTQNTFKVDSINSYLKFLKFL